MATILPFVIRRKAPVRVQKTAEEAAIVIFPGVRYETVLDTAAEPEPSMRRTAQRKRKTEPA